MWVVAELNKIPWSYNIAYLIEYQRFICYKKRGFKKNKIG